MGSILVEGREVEVDIPQCPIAHPHHQLSTNHMRTMSAGGRMPMPYGYTMYFFVHNLRNLYTCQHVERRMVK